MIQNPFGRNIPVLDMLANVKAKITSIYFTNIFFTLYNDLNTGFGGKDALINKRDSHDSISMGLVVVGT